jgi:flagellar basal-body rod modification protein FlgD
MIPSTTAAGQGASAEPAARNELSQLGAKQFITLMVAQLKNQDPMKPLEPAEFLGQLAQFSTVTGVQDMSRSMSELVGSMRSSQALEGAALVGREVLAPGTTAVFDGAAPVRGAVEAPMGASGIEVIVRDPAGSVVRRFAAPVRDAGIAEFAWDGRSDAGAVLPPGAYRVEALARSGGRTESLQTLLRSRVDSVTLDPAGGGLTLNTQNGSLSLGAVRRVM